MFEENFFLCLRHKMTNVFERARAIRMNGEPWQNAVQRAGSQLRYESQVAGAGKKGVKHPNYPKNRKSPTTDKCHFHKKKKTCRLSAKGRRTPEHQAWVAAHPGTANQRAARGRFATFAHEAKGSKGKGSVASHIKERYGPTGSRYGRRKAQDAADALGVPNLAGVQDGGAKKARKSPRTAYCSFHKKTGRCHRNQKARSDFPRRVKANTNPSPAQQRARENFARAARASSGIKDRAARNAALAQALRGQRGGWDGYSNTSSTRSSDFTSVSDSTSMSGGSWTSNDSSSLW